MRPTDRVDEDVGVDEDHAPGDQSTFLHRGTAAFTRPCRYATISRPRNFRGADWPIIEETVTMGIKRWICAIALALPAFALLGGGAPAMAQGKHVMKLAIVVANDPLHEFIKEYKRQIEMKSGGRITAELYPSAQLGKIPRLIEGLQLGDGRVLRNPGGLPQGCRPALPGARSAGRLLEPRARPQDDHRPAVPRQVPEHGDGQGRQGCQHLDVRPDLLRLAYLRFASSAISRA